MLKSNCQHVNSSRKIKNIISWLMSLKVAIDENWWNYFINYKFPYLHEFGMMLFVASMITSHTVIRVANGSCWCLVGSYHIIQALGNPPNRRCCVWKDTQMKKTYIANYKIFSFHALSGERKVRYHVAKVKEKCNSFKTWRRALVYRADKVR